MIWGYSPPQKKLKLWIRALLKKPRETQKAFLEWPTPEKHPLGVLRSSSMPCVVTEENPSKLYLKPCQKSSNETRARPLLNFLAYLHLQNPNPALQPKRTVSLSKCCVVLQNADETATDMLIKLLLKYRWKYLAQAGTRSPPVLRVRSPNGDTQCTKQCYRPVKQLACSEVETSSSKCT